MKQSPETKRQFKAEQDALVLTCALCGNRNGTLMRYKLDAHQKMMYRHKTCKPE
jgi:hypothetical protein